MMKRSIFLMLIILVLLGACEIKEFALPKWDVDLRIPLIYQRFYVSDLADEVNIIIDDDDVLTLVANGMMDTPEIGTISMYPHFSEHDLPVISGVVIDEEFPFVNPGLEMELHFGRVDSGMLRYKFDNVEPTADISIEFHNIKNDFGEKLKIVSGGGDGWQNIDLAGYHFGEKDAGAPLENIQLTVNSTSSLPSGMPIALFSIELTEPLYFCEFHGLLSDHQIGLNESTSAIEIEYPENINEAIILQEAALIIDVENQLQFRCEFEGEFVAIGASDQRTIQIKDNQGNNFAIEPATADGPSITRLFIENGLNDLLQVMPTQVLMNEAKFNISTEHGSGKLKSTDMLSVDYNISAPFKFILQDMPVTIGDPVRVEISEDNQEIFTERVVEAKMEFEIRNLLPLGGRADVFLSVDKDIDPDDPSSFNFAKSVTLLSHQASDGEPQYIPLILDNEELRIFSNPEVFLKWRFSFEDTHGEPVTVHAGDMDYIELRSMVSAKVLIGEID